MSAPLGSGSLLENALAAATDTKVLRIGRDNLAETATVFKSQFGDATAIIVCDEVTMGLAGNAVSDALKDAGIPCDEPHIFPSDGLYAEYSYVEQLDATLKNTDAIAVAVGSGTINDLAKLSSCHVGRPYMCVATAASMDGYTAFGASITFKGAKQTFNCPAPRAVVADLNVVSGAPVEMNASGYADLQAKITAGADWILADAANVEKIDKKSWEMVQEPLRGWLTSPEGVKAGEAEPIEGLLEGLMMGGFAMQWSQSSRPASGAEHQFSHLWDMEGHKYQGYSVSHGFKVGIGTLISTALHEFLLTQPVDRLDIEKRVASWKTREEVEAEINALYSIDDIRVKCLEEANAKYVDAMELRDELHRLKTAWPLISETLKEHVLPFEEVKARLKAVGAPYEPEHIGVSREKLKVSCRMAYHLRRRYTILDALERIGVWDEAMEYVFGPNGVYAI